MAINAEPIEDIDSTDIYIKDLENEIDGLRKQLKKLSKVKKVKEVSKPLDTNCCERYKFLLNSYHKILDEIIPF